MTRFFLIIAVFLTPLFFLPLTAFPLSLNRQLFFFLAVFLSLIFWISGGLLKGKISYSQSPVYYILSTLLLFVFLSAWLSGSTRNGFFGISGGEADTLFNILAFGVLLFLLATVFSSDKDKQTTLSLFIFSAFFALLFGLFQIFRIWLLPWSFTQNPSFNTIGTTNALSVFLGTAFFVLLLLLYLRADFFKKNKFRSIFFTLFSIILFSSVFLIGFWPALAASVLLSAIFLILIARDKFPINQAAVIAIAAVFIISLAGTLVRFNVINLKIPAFNLPPEITFSLAGSRQVVEQTFSQGVKNFIFGSGPTTFLYQHNLAKDKTFNLTPFWSFGFDQGTNSWLTHLVNWGVAGTLLWAVFIILILIRILKLFLKPIKKQNSVIIASAFGFLFIFFNTFFYPQNFVLYFTLFVLAGLLIEPEFKTISFNKNIYFLLGALVLIVLCVWLIYLQVSHYFGAVYFAKGVSVSIKPENISQTLSYLNKALDRDPDNDMYLRAVSNLHLIRANSLTDNQDEFVAMINNGVLAAKKATEVNVVSSQNWLNLGRVYENLILLVDGAAENSFSAYQKAIALEPNGPTAYFSLGRAQLKFAERLQNSGANPEQIETQRQQAQDNLQKALELKPDLEE